MKKIILSTLVACAFTTMHAQTSAEAIISSCPTMPSDHAIAEYIVKGDNATVKKYYQQLGEAFSKSNKAAMVEFKSKDFAKEQENIEKKQKQIMSKQADRMEAGKRMQKFMASLTPEQQKKMMSFRNEADAFQYLASIGKLDELKNLMEGVSGAAGDKTPVDKSDLQLMKRDLTSEMAAANESISNLTDSLRIMDEKLLEEAGKTQEASMQAHKDKSGGKAGGLWDQEAVDNDMISFWESKLPARKLLLKNVMQAIRNAIPVAKMRDKQLNAQHHMNGMSPLTALESTEYSKALEYLGAAKNILPGEGYGSDIMEMMEDKTQQINSNK